MLFINNKYTRWYYYIINRAVARNLTTRAQAKRVLGYVEKHHIVPKSIGGNNSKNNLVFLTAKEHFVAHHLLTQMTTLENRDKMVLAAFCMATVKNEHTKIRYKVSARVFESLRVSAARALSKLEPSWKGKESHLKGKTKHNTPSIAAAAATRKENNHNYATTAKEWRITNVLTNEVITVGSLRKWAEGNGLVYNAVNTARQIGSIHANYYITSIDATHEVPRFTRWLITDSDGNKTLHSSLAKWCKNVGVNYNTAFGYYLAGKQFNGYLIRKISSDELQQVKSA